MRDLDIRYALKARFDVEHAHDLTTVFIDELDLCGQVRVDMAVINGTLSGYELKSDRDTLRRLPAQIDLYGQVLDHATLVVGVRHHERALATLPPWWGVIVAVWDGEHVTLQDEREPHWNEAVLPLALVQLLWRNEALEELTARGLDAGLRSKPRQHLWNRLAAEVPLTELREMVRDRLKSRKGWRSPPSGA